MSDKKHLRNENYLGFFLLIVALMAFAVIVKGCNVAQYQYQQQQQQVITHDAHH